MNARIVLMVAGVGMFAGCSSSRGRSGSGVEGGAGDGAMTRTVPAGPCGRLAEVRGQRCPRENARCKTEGWACVCSSAPEQRCSGAEMPPGPPLPATWRCHPLDPATPRADGCPWGLPAGGSPCSPEGKVCSYGSECGGGWGRATCTSGSWSVEEGIASDPP